MLAECMTGHEIEWYREIFRLYDKITDIIEAFFMYTGFRGRLPAELAEPRTAVSGEGISLLN